MLLPEHGPTEREVSVRLRRRRDEGKVASLHARDLALRDAQLATELRDAIEDGQLVLHYQPIMYLPSGEIPQ